MVGLGMADPGSGGGMGLAPAPPAPVSARQQFAAISWLRWRLFVNGFRRKGSKAELAARIVLIPFAIALLGGPVVAAGFVGFYAVAHRHLDYLAPLFAALFVYQLVISVNIAPPELAFEPQSLIRFPLAFPRYLAIRLGLGLLAVSTVTGTLALVASAIGIALAQPALALPALAAVGGLALVHLLFIRMVYIWVDRWLSTRRAREVFTAVIVAASLGIQWANVTFNPGLNTRAQRAQNAVRLAQARAAYTHIAPALHLLPPGLAADSIGHSATSQPLLALLCLLGILAFAALFLAIFAWRIGKEYRGENLSEAGARPSESPLPSALPAASPATFGLSPAFAACLRKEILYTRRNTSQFYAYLAPVAMVFLFAARVSRGATHAYTLPLATAYSVLGASVLAYNCFGLDATGMQFYLLAPVPLRTVVLAKNLLTCGLTLVEFVLVLAVVIYSTGAPPLPLALATLAWAVLAVLVNVMVGNLRSISAPKKIDAGKVGRNQTPQLSGLLAIGVMLVLTALGFGLLVLAHTLHLAWLPLAVLTMLAAAAMLLYRASLATLEDRILTHRESLLEELAKTG